MNAFQQQMAQQLAALKAAGAGNVISQYTNPNVDPENIISSDPYLQFAQTSSEGAYDPNEVARIQAQRRQILGQQGGATTLAQMDYDAAVKDAQAGVDWAEKYGAPRQGGGFLDTFMRSYFPMIVGALVVGGASGALSFGGAEAATAAGATGAGSVGEGLATIGSDIAGTLPVDVGGSLSNLGWMDGVGVGAGDVAGGIGAGSGVAEIGAGGLPTNIGGMQDLGFLNGMGGEAAGAVPGGMVGVEGSGTIPSVSVPAPAGAAGGGVSPGVTAGAGGAAGLPAIASGAGDALQVPDEFIDNAEQAYNDQTAHIPDIKAGDFSTGGSNLLDTLNNIKNVGKPILDIVGAINDNKGANNTADNATKQLQDLLNAGKDAQGRNDYYLSILQNLGNGAVKSSADYKAQMDGRLNSMDQASQGYLANMNSLAQGNMGRDESYQGVLDTLAQNSIADNKNYLATLTGMYQPGTPEAIAMQKEMEAKDAATGRRSQYGTRAVDLAAEMAKQRAGIMTSGAYTNAMDNKNAQGIYGSQGYINAMHRTGASDIYNSGAYQSNLAQTAQNGLLTSGAYQNAVNNKPATDIFTSPAYAGTVNNSGLMSLLSSPAYLQLNQQQTQAQNGQYNSALGTLSSLFSNSNTLGNAFNSIKSLFGGS